MTTNYYVNYDTGDDAYDGTNPIFQTGTVGPKKHISAAVALVADPLSEETIINLAGEVGTPLDYTLDEVDETIDLS